MKDKANLRHPSYFLDRVALLAGVDAFFGAAFLGAAFLGAAFLGAAFLGAAFLGAAFLGAAARFVLQRMA